MSVQLVYQVKIEFEEGLMKVGIIMRLDSYVNTVVMRGGRYDCFGVYRVR